MARHKTLSVGHNGEILKMCTWPVLLRQLIWDTLIARRIMVNLATYVVSLTVYEQADE